MDKILKKGSEGVIILEASWVLLITCIIMCIFTSMGFIIYQRCVVNIVADEAAWAVADNYTTGQYSYEKPSIGTGTINWYKYMFDNQNDHLETAKEHATSYATDRIKKMTFGIMQGDPEINVYCHTQSFCVRTVEVEMKIKYSFVFDGVLRDILGMKEPFEFVARGTSDCTDISNMTNTMWIYEKINDAADGTAIGKLIGSMQKYFKFFK